MSDPLTNILQITGQDIDGQEQYCCKCVYNVYKV